MKKRMLFLLIFGILCSTAIPALAKSKVEYNGEGKGLIVVPDDFFAEFGTMMPGDIKEESVTITNSEKDTIEIYFRTKLEDDLQKMLGTIKEPQTERERSAVLLEKIKLKIEIEKGTENRIIYEGDLAATALNNGVFLGKYSSGEESTLNFCIEIPKDLGNSYADSNTDVIWEFSVKSEIVPTKEVITKESTDSWVSRTEIESSKSIPDKSDSISPSFTIDKRESSDAVILGISDYSQILGVIFTVIGILGVAWLIIRRKKS